MTFDLRAQLLVDLGNWQAGLSKASKQMTGFGKSMKTISNGIKAGFAGVAFLGVASLYDGIVDLTKAAADDNRSMALLNEQMRRTWKGNSKLNQSIDKQIDAMSNATGIADDKLRPALIRIAAVTKGPRKGMKMLSLATDIAAKSGQDLNLVSRNVAKFLGGNKTALDKLVPGLSSAGDRMAYLTKNYTGFAVISGKNDPFGRIAVIIDNFKEKLGKAFLPLANNFAEWLGGSEAQGALDAFAKRVTDAFAYLNSPEGKKNISEWFQKAKQLVKQLIYIVDGFSKFLGMMPGNIVQKKIDAAGGSTFIEQRVSPQFSNPTSRAIIDPFNLAASMYADQNKVTPAKAGQTIYNIYGVMSGNDVVKALRGEANKKGKTVLGLITG